MKKIFSLLLLCAAVVLSPGCKDDDDNNGVVIAVTDVSLDQSTVSVKVGETVTLKATVAPEDASNKKVTWKSSSMAATVKNGVVTGASVGSATITVTTVDGGKTAICVVTVSDDGSDVAVTGVTLNKSTASLEIGEKLTLVPTVAPANASNKLVTWSSSNPAAATVADGVVTAVADGNTTITVATVDGGKKASCDVTVTAAAGPVSLKTGNYVVAVAFMNTSGEEETYDCDITIEEGQSENQYWIDGLFGYEDLKWNAIFDPAAMTLTMDGYTDQDDDNYWLMMFTYWDDKKTQGAGILCGESGEEPCVINVGVDGAPTEFATELDLFVADLSTMKILGIVEVIKEGTPITAGAAAPQKKSVKMNRAVVQNLGKAVRK